MEHRKLIKFGNSSYVISLPKKWITKNKLEKGNSVFFQEGINGEISLKANFSSEEEKKPSIIQTDNISPKSIRREIISSYMNDHRTIILSGKRENYQEKIQELIQDLIGVEIVEETSERLVLKDFIDVHKVSISEMLQRTDIILRSMIEDMIQCLKKDLYDSINPRDITINKLRFMILKMVRNSMVDSSLMSKFKNSDLDPLYVFILLFNMEDIADNTRRIARILAQSKLTNKEKDILEQIYKKMQRMYLEVMKSHHKKDKNFASEVANRKGEISNTCEKIIDNTNNKDIIKISEKCKIIENSIMVVARAILDKP